MSLPVLAFLVVACVSAEQQESDKVGSRSPVEEKSLMAEDFQNRAVESSEKGIVDHLKPRMHSIEEYALRRESATKLEEQDQSVSDDEGRPEQQTSISEDDAHPLLWDKLEVPYELNNTMSKRAKSAFRKAARLWTNFTCINITEEPYEDDDEGEENGEPEYDYEYGDYGNESDYSYYPYDVEDEDASGYITVYGGGEACVSGGIGKSRYDWQYIILGRKCETIGTAAHELAHALGFIHAQQRHDRDEHITVDMSSIEAKYHDQFEPKSNKSYNNHGVPYDYGSVMQYGITAGSKNRTKLTMLPKDGLYNQTLGSPLVSFYDILMMNKLYNCTDKCENYTSTQCRNGGFPHPRNCDECICPSGYGGRLCDQRPAICGEEVNATSNWTLLITADSSNMTHGSQDGFKKCVYWIVAPNGSHVEVRLTKLPPNVAKEGCIYAGVEIKARADQRLTGYRFCSENDVNLTLISNTSTLPVLTYMRRRRNDTAAELEYRIAEKNNEELI